jgi:hypothetical protein
MLGEIDSQDLATARRGKAEGGRGKVAVQSGRTGERKNSRLWEGVAFGQLAWYDLRALASLAADPTPRDARATGNSNRGGVVVRIKENRY